MNSKLYPPGSHYETVINYYLQLQQQLADKYPADLGGIRINVTPQTSSSQGSATQGTSQSTDRNADSTSAQDDKVFFTLGQLDTLAINTSSTSPQASAEPVTINAQTTTTTMSSKNDISPSNACLDETRPVTEQTTENVASQLGTQPHIGPAHIDGEEVRDDTDARDQVDLEGEGDLSVEESESSLEFDQYVFIDAPNSQHTRSDVETLSVKSSRTSYKSHIPCKFDDSSAQVPTRKFKIRDDSMIHTQREMSKSTMVPNNAAPSPNTQSTTSTTTSTTVSTTPNPPLNDSAAVSKSGNPVATSRADDQVIVATNIDPGHTSYTYSTATSYSLVSVPGTNKSHQPRLNDSAGNPHFEVTFKNDDLDVSHADINMYVNQDHYGVSTQPQLQPEPQPQLQSILPSPQNNTTIPKVEGEEENKDDSHPPISNDLFGSIAFESDSLF